MRKRPGPGTAARLRQALVWAGIATLAALALLASAHLVADLAEVLGGPGRRDAVLGRVGIAGALGLGCVALALVVAWLAGGPRRRQLAAVAVGFASLVVVRAILSWQLDAAGGEPVYYPEMAALLLSGEVDFRGRPPGYTVALAGAYLVVADRQLAAEILNLLLAVAAGGAVLGLAGSLYGLRVAALALLGYALWPAGALMTSVPMPHVAFDAAVVVAAWAAVATPTGRRGDALSGALLGVAQYLRPLSPFLLPSWILARVWHGTDLRSLLATVGVTVVAFLLALLPAIAWNLERAGTLSISTSDWGGHSMFIGTYEPSGGQYTEEADALLKEISGPMTIAERSALGSDIAMQRIREDLIGMAALGIRKQDALWGTEHYGIQYALRQGLGRRPGHPDASTPILVSQAFYVLVLASAAAGLWLLRRRPDALVPLVVTLIWVVSLMHALVEVRDRHHAYVVPLLLPLSALAVTAAYTAAARRLARSRGA
jgi:hypothetical protein